MKQKQINAIYFSKSQPQPILMKKEIAVSIPKPCHASWNTFDKTSHGGYCSACCKEVIDFTAWSDADLIHYLETYAHVCGRFRKDQLKSYTVYHNVLRFRLPFKAAWIAGLLSLTSVTMASAQVTLLVPPSHLTIDDQVTEGSFETPVVKTIEGRVIDEEGAPMPGVNVIIKDAAEGTVTDVNGRFTLKNSLDENPTLIFSFIGMAPKEMMVTSQDIHVKLEDITIEWNTIILGEAVVCYRKWSRRGIWYRIKNLF
jgi:hypothetical protein